MNPIKKIYLSSFLFGLVIILLITFLILPLFKGINKSSEELLLGKKKLILLDKEGESIKKTQEIYEIYQSDLKKMEELFPDPNIPIEIINFLEKTAKLTRVQLEIFSVAKKTEKEDPWPSFSLQLSVSGSFPDFCRFLEKIEAGVYLIKIQNLNINRLSEGDLRLSKLEKPSLGDVKADFTLKVFTQ